MTDLWAGRPGPNRDKKVVSRGHSNNLFHSTDIILKLLAPSLLSLALPSYPPHPHPTSLPVIATFGVALSSDSFFFVCLFVCSGWPWTQNVTKDDFKLLSIPSLRLHVFATTPDLCGARGQIQVNACQAKILPIKLQFSLLSALSDLLNSLER